MIGARPLISALAVSVLVVASPAYAQSNTGFTGNVPGFLEQASSAGINHQYRGPWEYYVGGGAAGFDCNGDRFPDVFLAGGENPAGLYVNRSEAGGELLFEQTETGLSEKDLGKVLGAYPVNLDNDQYIDLVVLRLGRNLLLKGQGDCRFKKANRQLAFDGGKAWTTAFAATWQSTSDYPLLAFGNYVDKSAPGSPWGTCDKNVLYRSPDGNAPVYESIELLEPSHCTLSLLFTDWNNTGQIDLRVTNDRQYHRGGQEQLWHVPEESPARQYTEAEGWRPLVIWGMGIAEADLDNDGLPEYALSSMGDTLLQRLDDDAFEDTPVYRDIAYERGATAHRPYTGDDSKPSTGWHTRFDDFNNDALLDLFIAKGNVEQMPDFAAFDPDNLLLGNHEGSFVEQGEAAGLALDRRGRGALSMDFNNDGLLDLLVVNREDPVSLFRNLGAKTEWGYRPMGNWLAIELDNGKINPQAIGARIVIKTGNLAQTRTIQVGGGHASGQLGFMHAGLGVAERATVRVRWPDGEWSHEYRVFANQFVVLSREMVSPRYWYPVSGDGGLK